MINEFKGGDCTVWRSRTLPQGHRFRFLLQAAVVIGAAVMAPVLNEAKAADLLPPPSPVLPTYSNDPVTNYFLHWYDRVHEAQATQPHWMTPLVTVTPRLEQEFRYDQLFETAANGSQTAVMDNGKGLELIPTTTNEILLNLPAFQERTIVKPAQGTADWGFLTIKQRLLSANEENGNYILSTFLGFTAPTGATVFTNKAWIITPTVAGGIGFGDFDIQGTVGVQIPTDQQSVIGTAVVSNVAFQYHLFKYLWPEFELNDTAWSGGERHGQNQLFLTPGIIFGRFNLGPPTVNLNVGIGYQFAVTPVPAVLEPVMTPVYNHAWLLTARLTF
jgi:hypothetical protein